MRPGQEYSERTGRAGLVDTLLLPIVRAIPTPSSNKLLAHLQRFLVGEMIVADIAGSIEGPLRLAPQQKYSIRIRIMGRSTAVSEHGGLSSLACGDEVNMMICSALNERYAYLLHEIAVAVPVQDSLLEVTVPLIAIDSEQSWHRERLQVYFFDGLDQPLYEKPFAFDLIVSPRVSPGKEGYVAMTIPL
jgi:hypothetical protein